MKKFGIQAILLVIIIFAALYTFHTGLQNIPITLAPLPQNSITIDGTRINIETANTPAARRLGLGGRDSLATNSGMLFVFDQEGTQTFWMKGMHFPLDFIWIRSNKVVDITKNALPPTKDQPDSQLPLYIPREPVTKVLEVNSGFVDAHDIKIGDKIEGLASPSASPRSS